ncbi:alpha/beta hydrolase family protein [Paractinoplanes maris]|uniref:alpha/beta hydrolase family protein n=1 Tax=Paractinoplanes maris TaxID=1734446 RepID=UPI0020207ACB|nr:prolyl oligopeptidase family serine peptidase [Actinoplanes maris]
MGRVHRRPVALALAVAVLSTTLVACSSEQPSESSPTALPSAASIPPAPGAATTPGAPGATAVPGATTAPGATSAPTGSFAVETRTLKLQRDDRALPTTVWQPKGTGPFPLILFSHGLGGKPSDYRELLTTWARAGFVVAAPAYPHTSASATEFNVLDVLNQPTDASYVITEALAELGPVVDQNRIAAAGHSAGGVTTLGLFSGSRDERLRAGVVLAGRQVLPQPFIGRAAPLLFVHGRKDATVAYADGRAAYNAVTWPKAFLSVTEGGHVASGRSLDVIAATSTDFWRWTLYGDAKARTRLQKDATRGGLATLTNSL